eukprot:TRINITY_DN2422_c0_g1_i5.p3 TRINITY_DN2422_c0_g1~~TRINITY_DN2422_c0_g1_i5.p3  ORF type:complete len:150 (+),score=67.03 TRINITY_DN2422_c0_g1_i5:92-541(+)
MPKPNQAQLRQSLAPGVVCIMLAGRFRGKRVVMLKQDEKTGTLVVTGPYKLNGVPIRRVDPAYVIATSQKIDVSQVDTKAVGSDFFARPKKDSKKPAEKTGLPAAKKAVQQKVDEALLKAVKAAGDDVGRYLHATFSLGQRDMPHRMKF